MEIISIAVIVVVFILVNILPETEAEAQAVENRRLRKQRQRGNYESTPRTSPRKTEKLTLQSAYKEYQSSRTAPDKLTRNERMEVAKSIGNWKQSINAMYAVKMDYARSNSQKEQLISDRNREIAEGEGAYYRKYGIK